MFEVKNLKRGNVIKDVSFELYKGEIVGFAGLMGAGRTEVARAIFGADPLDSGEILLKEKDRILKILLMQYNMELAICLKIENSLDF
ncbi:ATP-binding cassette domain-containing protein [Bacillus pacificus]